MNVKITRPEIINEIPLNLKEFPNLSEFSKYIEYTIGNASTYFSEIFDSQTIKKLKNGQSILITAPVGCGKTTTLIQIATSIPNDVVFITNRKGCYLQLKRDILKAQGVNVKDWSEEAIKIANTNNIKVTTYQSLAHKDSLPRFCEGTLLILDECHYLLNDATFSFEPMRIKEMLFANRDKTKRIYMSATIDEVAPEIYHIERKDDNRLPYQGYDAPVSRIQCIYHMESDWNHLNFKFYEYSNLDKLAEYLNNASNDGIKSAIFVRNKEHGNVLKEKLKDSQFVFSSDEEKETLSNIAFNERFECNSLVATKVIENGVSINDDNIGIVVIEEIDHVSFMQFLGRIRTKRNNPRSITVLIPDYTPSELKQVLKQYNERLDRIKYVIDFPEKCMRNYEHYTPYIYYSEDGSKANTLAFTKFMNLKKHIENLIEEEEQELYHAHIHSVLKMLNLPEEISDNQFLNYDDFAIFKTGVTSAYEEFISSPKLKEDRDLLAQKLISVVLSTNSYKKKITGNQLQLDKINDILHCAGIKESLYSLGEAFGVNDSFTTV